MEDKLSPKAVEKFLTDIQLRELHLVLEEPGWEAVKLVAQKLRSDWAEQITRFDYRHAQEVESVRDLIFRQGMLHGLEQFIYYLQTKHDKQLKKDEH